MKKLICLTLLLASISLGSAQKPKRKSALRSASESSAQSSLQSPLQSMVATELAFTKMSVEQGVRPSFMAFIADDGILFRPRAVKGKQWMTEHPVPPSDKRPVLSWYPTVADIARAGDMGYTTGPWEYKSDIHDAKPVAFGNFLTVWKRQADGSWKFAIDLGISNPPPDKPAPLWQLPKGYRQPAKGPEVNVQREQAALFSEDSVFSSISNLNNAQTDFGNFAAPNVRVFRNDKFPLVGKAAGSSVFSANVGVWTWEPALVNVSRSGDLGYTYGTYRITSNDSAEKILERGNYYRVWKKQAGKWKVVADLTNPVPEDKKN
jgi:ketosteroid isomerase-like protein